ncbi:hypothetical protein R3P38DRAFT_1510203 [Favolaschia claudopus]|uniref:DUF2235 domain-containing protein n=1 Tax=Favolaschia claudopus TaxID=2862362 RepID=A0AAW0AKM2_9AGAR
MAHECPSVSELLANVKSLTRQNQGAFQTAWEESFSDAYHCCERGGFIYVDFPIPERITRAWVSKAGPGETMHQRTKGSNASINLNYPGIEMDNVILVANFHTHPLYPEEPVKGGQKPSEADRDNAYDRGLPGIVISRDGIYSYGPERRTNLQNPKVYPPVGVPRSPVEPKLVQKAPLPWTVPKQWPEGTGPNDDNDGYVIIRDWADENSYARKFPDNPTSKGPKRLFVFCDGTAQDGMLAPDGPTEFLDSAQAYEHGITQMMATTAGSLPTSDAPYVTNVLRLSRSVKRWSNDDATDENRMRQIVYYQSGVGSEADFEGRMGTSSAIMQAFGWAVASKIRDAYAFLAQNYEPGDELFLFGFSRGAYAARKLAQLIDKIGLLETESLGLFFEIWRSLVDGQTPIIPQTTRRVVIRCLGVWDTVGAVSGTPATLHLTDSVVPSIVENAFHAMSVQENRKEFRPTFFTLPANSTQTLKEVWFPGAHSDVGGSYERHELADISLFWMTGEILALKLFNLDEAFLIRSKQSTPRDDWGTSEPHNAYRETPTKYKYIAIHAQSRLESGDITSSIKFHESWKYAPNTLKDAYHMVTRKQLEEKFGSLNYVGLNEWEGKRKDHWKDESNETPIVYDDPRVLFPMYPGRWLGYSDYFSANGVSSTAFGLESSSTTVYVGNVMYKNALYVGKVLHDLKTIYIVSADQQKEIEVKSGARILAAPAGSFAWLRIQGELTREKLGCLTPVKAGMDKEGKPHFSARAYYNSNDKGIVGGEVSLGTSALLPLSGKVLTITDYNILVYKSHLYDFHNTAGQYTTLNNWESVKAGSINSSIISVIPTAVTPPIIVVALSKIDVSNNPSDNYIVRAKAYADSITTTSFRAHIDTWSTTTLYDGGLSWLKIASGDPEFRTGVFKCTKAESSWIDFNWRFETYPAVFVGISCLDIGAEKDSSSPPKYSNWQLKVYASDSTSTGFRMNVEQPGKSHFYNCWVSWVAYAVDKPGIDIGSFGGDYNTSSGYSGTSYFPPYFRNSPMVFTGITSLNIPNDQNLRLEVDTKVQSNRSMDWSIKTWSSSHLDSVHVNYIALDEPNPYSMEELKTLR